MSKKTPYHSATVKHKTVEADFCYLFQEDKITAMVIDLEKDLDLAEALYSQCDFIYADIPFVRGYDVFNQRVNKTDGKGWGYLMNRIQEFAKIYKRPIYLCGDRQHVKQLCSSEIKVMPILFSEFNTDATLIMFNVDTPIKAKTNLDLKEALFDRYDSGGDFCCGYGSTGRVGIQKNKQVFLSDINPVCIGHIKETWQSWKSDQ